MTESTGGYGDGDDMSWENEDVECPECGAVEPAEYWEEVGCCPKCGAGD